MEEEKKFQSQNNANPNSQGGRKRRRHKKKGNGGNGGNGGQTPAVNQNQNQNKPQPQQNGNKGNGQQNGHNQHNQHNQQKQKPVQPQQKPAQVQPVREKIENPAPAKKQENRKDTYAYQLDGNLYINLTNKCSNGCDFCVRNERSSYFGHYLWLNHGEPTTEKVISACNGMGDLTRYKEVVFCGFGEPTYRMEQMLALCDYFHEKGLTTRLNTNGQGVLINKRDIVPEMKGKIDKVSVSLNASCAEKYQKICRSQFGENGFGAMIEFAKSCKRAGIECRFTLVDYVGEEEVELSKKLAQSVNVPLVVRKYISDC